MSGNVNSHSSDVLFIDEGFGTLDENSLDHVMNCLESLQSNTGKRVGIISHREGLADRIDTHIEVIAKSETLSEVKVCQQNLRNGK
jgi:exonuclease SbcC